MLELTTRNIVYIVIVLLCILLIIWYLSVSREGLDNLDDVLSGVNSCGDPNGCKSNEEIKKETEGALSEQAAELAKTVKNPSNIVTYNMIITLNNNDEESTEPEIPESDISSTLLTPPIDPDAEPSDDTETTDVMETTDATETADSKTVSIPKIDTTPKGPKLNESKTDVNMLDVDRDGKGVKPRIYNISSLSVNYPDIELLNSSFGEYKKNSQLNDIYIKRHEEYKNFIAKYPLAKMPAIALNSKYSKGPTEQSFQIQLDASDSNNNFIIITPKTRSVFPSNFELNITNNAADTGVIFDLWSDSVFNQAKTQPSGNANRILDNKTLTEYLNKKGDTFGYSKPTFGDSCLVIEEKKCMVGGLNVGKRAINIIKSGNIYDENDKIIGSVSKQSTTATDMNEIIKINIENSRCITGIVLFVTYMQ